MTSPTIANESCGPINQSLNQKFFVNGTFSCDVMFEDFLRGHRLLFDQHHLAKIVVIWVIFFLSCSGNSAVLFSVNGKRKQERSGNTQLLMTHLAIANLIFTFFVLPMDAIWNCTLEWRGGDILCRALNMLKQFAMYMSSSAIVVLVLVRLLTLLYPVPPNQQRKRVKLIIAVAWVLSFTSGLPGVAMFSTIDHWPMKCQCPKHYFHQCVDFMLIHGVGKQIFHMYSMCASFFVPVVIVIVCYIIMAIAIKKLGKREEEDHNRNPIFGGRKNEPSKGLAKAKKTNQLMTLLITLAFVICWCPYYIIGVIHWFNLNHEPIVDVVAEEVMLLSVYFNPCLHPFIIVMLNKDIRSRLRAVVTSIVLIPGNWRRGASSRKNIKSKDISLLTLHKEETEMTLFPSDNRKGQRYIANNAVV
ncbi:gonadotropin-releasing hormone receptor-like isoform X1 [Clavelina lepadiformis]|uniref:gonadotropin-releasing hormone receptor-like isoform X1 n=1 Tax=Clavelina lepadiformis TaxID=159417 RepID=UPI004041D86C